MSSSHGEVAPLVPAPSSNSIRDSTGDTSSEHLTQISEVVGSPSPTTLTFITTHQCTAACKGCCFQCSPKGEGRMSLEQMRRLVDTAIEAFPELKLVVFTGGECFLLGRDLALALDHCRTRGLSTRCVTNGYWATSPAGIAHHLTPLIEAGLGELNVSTGDEHQRFVPWERVRNAALAGARAGLTTLISVEAAPSSKFSLSNIYADGIVADFKRVDPNAHRLLFIASSWADFESSPTYGARSQETRRSGCEELFGNIVIEPDGNMLACCGLQAHKIPEFRLGLAPGPAALRAAYLSQFGDFSKLWLWADGSARIWEVISKGRANASLDSAIHKCHICHLMFAERWCREAMAKNYEDHIPDVVFRLSIREQLIRRTR